MTASELEEHTSGVYNAVIVPIRGIDRQQRYTPRRNNQQRALPLSPIAPRPARRADNRLVIHISRVIIIHTSSETAVCKGKLPAGPAGTPYILAHTYVVGA